MTSKQSGKASLHEGLSISAQQSRFHTDATEASTKEIIVKDLCISLGNREIVSHAELKLMENVHYVLVGRNGTGKSTILRALGAEKIPGVARNIRILFLGQTASEHSGLDEALSDLTLESGVAQKSVLEHVLRSDKEREKALRQVKVLSDAFNATENPLAIVQAVRRLKHEQLELATEEAADIAARRSGARGLRARKALIAQEEQLAASTLLLNQDESEISLQAVQEESNAGIAMLEESESYLKQVDSSAAESRATSILLGLGFPQEKLLQPFTTLSGGWQTRCELACALFKKADVLLLDECTNYLDLPAVIWLQSYLQTLTDTTVVAVTHDRDFADAIADELLVLREQQIEYFKGNLSHFEREKRKRIRYMSRLKANEEKKTAHLQNTIKSNIRSAKRHGDDNKLKQAASRRKKLDERSGLEVGRNGARFKLSRDRAGFQLSKRAEIEVPTLDPPVRLAFPNQPPELRFPGALLSIENASFAYQSASSPSSSSIASKAAAPVLSGINLVIHPGERVGICGLNGSGKSTLVGIATGAITCSTGGGGSVTRHPRAIVGHYSQHSVEALDEVGTADPHVTSLAHLLAHSNSDGGTATGLLEPEARKVLGALGLAGRVASDVPICALSGGQKVRLALAKLFCNVSPHLLILDEVTTHLDADTVLALLKALRRYSGAILVVTHDRFFMRCLVEGASLRGRANDEDDDDDDDGDDSDDDYDGDDSDGELDGKGPGGSGGGAGHTFRPARGRVYRIVKGRLKLLPGGMNEYEEIAERSAAKASKR
ncbi:MAG: hypothetical protein M1825_003560 [Sarcosagium campestre]|nr:MAG: hypothetical protein M1825_003560 [Sarcosagium campestre]